MDWNKPGFPVHHLLPEFTQTNVHWVGDSIQPSHPLSSPSPSTFNFSQHQGLFQWVISLHQMAKVLSFIFSISPSSDYSGLNSMSRARQECWAPSLLQSGGQESERPCNERRHSVCVCVCVCVRVYSVSQTIGIINKKRNFFQEMPLQLAESL